MHPGRWRRPILPARWLLALAVAAGIGVGAFAEVFACADLPRVTLDQVSGAPGSTAMLRGSGFLADSPVEVHWGPADGPVLATGIAPGTQGAFAVSITVPATATAGMYAVVANQSPNVVARAVFEVTPAVRQASHGEDPAAQPAGAPVDTPASDLSGTLLLAGLGGGACLMLVGAAVIISWRRRRRYW